MRGTLIVVLVAVAIVVVVASMVVPMSALPGRTGALGGAQQGAASQQPGSSQPAVAGQQATTPSGFRVERVASGLAVPWALAFAPDGRLFFTERPGRIRVMVEGQLLTDPVATLPAVTTAESGLMGLALDPEFQDNGYIYVDYTYRNDQGGLLNRVSRLTVQGNQAADEKVLLDGIPASSIHDGGRVKIGPAAKLFVTAGDASNPDSAQALGTLSGKILRLNPDGSIPDDNPFLGSPVFSYGHRNPEGLAFQLGTGQLIATEYGQVGNDEVNVIDAGRNYGWPVVQGIPHDQRYMDPIASYSPSIAPTGATFYDGNRFPDWIGSLFFTSLRGQHLHRIVLGGADGRQMASEERLLDGEFGRLRDIIQGPDGFLYFSTSNRDGRGTPISDDDRILRIVPR